MEIKDLIKKLNLTPEEAKEFFSEETLRLMAVMAAYYKKPEPQTIHNPICTNRHCRNPHCTQPDCIHSLCPDPQPNCLQPHCPVESICPQSGCPIQWSCTHANCPTHPVGCEQGGCGIGVNFSCSLPFSNCSPQGACTDWGCTNWNGCHTNPSQMSCIEWGCVGDPWIPPSPTPTPTPSPTPTPTPCPTACPTAYPTPQPW